MRSEEFRTGWATHNARLHRSGTKHFHHRWSATCT
jgi:hypothetical protein